MKRTILAILLLASISLTSFATTNISQQKRERKDFPSELKLSDEQKKQMKEINKDFTEKIESVKKSRIAPDAQQEKIKALREEKREAIGKILTPEQKTIFEKRTPKEGEKDNKREPRTNKKEAMSPKLDSEKGMKDEGRSKMFDNLNLTDAQKEQMKSIREKYTTENKETAGKMREEMVKILTPEQQKQLEANRAKFAESRKNRKPKTEKAD